ncbi:MAG: hypothetical protein AB7I19_17300 [Planctomycetota bacterium]
MIRILLRSVLTLVLLCTVLRAQRTWIVDRQSGPGTDFTDLLPAMDAAVSGDTILLVPRSGVQYNTPGTRFEYIRKSLRIIGLGSEPVRLYGALQFHSAPREQVIVLANLDMETTLVDLFECHGTIVCDRLLRPASPSLPYGFSVRVVENCGNLVVSNSDFQVAFGPAVDIRSARNAFIQNSRIEDLRSSRISPFPSGAVLGSEVQLWITQSTLIGGIPSASAQWQFYDWGVAVGHPRNGRVANLFIGPGNSISGAPHPSGGSAGFPFRVTCTHPTHQNSVKQAYSQIPSIPVEPSMLAYDPSSSFIGCRDNDNNEIVHEFASVIPGQALRGQSQTLDLWGPTSSILAVYASFLHPGDPITLPIGDVWLDPALIVHVGNTAVDHNRRASLTTTIPTWINPGEVLVYQALALSPQQPFELSPPGFAVVR